MQYIIVIDGSYWQLLEDGSLQAISPQEFLLLQKAGDIEVIQSSKLVKNNTASNSSGSNSGVSAQDPTINLASFFDNISRTGNEQLPDSGFLSGPLSDFLTDTEQNSIDEPSLPPPLSEDAQACLYDPPHCRGQTSLRNLAVPHISIRHIHSLKPATGSAVAET